MTSIPRLWLPVLMLVSPASLLASSASLLASSATAQVVPYAMSWEEPAQVRAEGYDYDHEVLVALPPSYHVSPERSYPVLWSMDGAMAFAMTAGIVNLYALGARIPEIIVVGVGHPSEEGMAGLGKRTFDLFPPGSVVADEGVAAEYTREELGLDFATMEPLLKGDRFLDFLVEQLRRCSARSTAWRTTTPSGATRPGAPSPATLCWPGRARSTASSSAAGPTDSRSNWRRRTRQSTTTWTPRCFSGWEMGRSTTRACRPSAW